MFTVGGGPTEVHETYSVFPMTVSFDWASFEEQSRAAGTDPDQGVDPWMSLYVKFVTAGGRSYDSMDDYSVTVPNEWFGVGTVYPPAESVTANVAISVPAAEVAGGTWSVTNMDGEGVFIAAVPAG